LYKREGARIIDKLMGDPYTKLVFVGQRKPFSNGRVQHGFLKKKKKEEEEGLKYFLLVLVWLCGRVYIFPGVEKSSPFVPSQKEPRRGPLACTLHRHQRVRERERVEWVTSHIRRSQHLHALLPLFIVRTKGRNTPSITPRKKRRNSLTRVQCST
jgi:hypothetical protein